MYKNRAKIFRTKNFTKITFLSLQNVGWTGFHYSRKEEYTAASIDVAPYGKVYAPKLTSPPPEGYDTSVAFAIVIHLLCHPKRARLEYNIKIWG